MFKKIFVAFTIIVLLFCHVSKASSLYEDLLYKEINQEFNTVDGYHKLQKMTRDARNHYQSNNGSASKYLAGNIRYGLTLFEDLKHHFDASYVIAYLLNSKVDPYMNPKTEDGLKEEYITEFFKENQYNIFNINDIFEGASRLSFTHGKPHKTLQAKDKLSLDAILDESIQNESYPLIYGDMANISSLNGRTGTALLPVMFCNYFLNSSTASLLKEPDDFSKQVGNFLSPQEIESYFYISLDDASRIINNHDFLGVEWTWRKDE